MWLCISWSFSQTWKCGRYCNIQSKMPWRCTALFVLPFVLNMFLTSLDETSSHVCHWYRKFNKQNQLLLQKSKYRYLSCKIFLHHKTTRIHIPNKKTISNFKFIPKYFLSDSQGVSGEIFLNSGVRSLGSFTSTCTCSTYKTTSNFKFYSKVYSSRFTGCFRRNLP